jgi:acetoin utilization protein AcuB
MFVKFWMSTPVITVDAQDSMRMAMKLLDRHRIHSLPVMKKGKLVGMVTDRDIKQKSASDATTLTVHEVKFLLSRIKVAEIMTRPPITVSSESTLEQTARILMEKNISGAPVVTARKAVVGMITRSDLLRVMVNLTGVDKRGIQLAFQVVDRPESIFELTDIIREHDGHIVSILTSYENAKPGYRNVVIRAYRMDRRHMHQLLKALRRKVTVLYMVDHREDEQEETPLEFVG